MARREQPSRRLRGASSRAAELFVLGSSASLVGAVWRCDGVWLLRHASLDARHLGIAQAARVLVALGAILVAGTLGPRARRWVERVGGPEALRAFARVVGALALALAVSELALRLARAPKKHDFLGSCDNDLAEPDPRLGWVWKPRFELTRSQGWRQVHYRYDAEHDRAPTVDDVKDPERPTVLLVGESIVAGHGLQWEETLPAQVSEGLGVQVVPLGVDGYGCDQAFVRLVDTLPRYPHVVAIVTLFFPGLVDRVGWVDRPRVSFGPGGLTVAPADPGPWSDLRLVRLLHDVVPYRDEASIELTGRIFLETARLARDRGARAVFLTPSLADEPPGAPRGDRYLIDALLVEPGLTVVDPLWGYEPITGDRHPNARSTRRLAEALVAALGPEIGRL